MAALSAAITVLFLQDQWHYSALRAGLAISPGPLSAAISAVNSGRIAAHQTPGVGMEERTIASTVSRSVNPMLSGAITCIACRLAPPGSWIGASQH